MPEPIELLTNINLDDLVGALGWSGRARLSRLARWAFRRPAESFARQMLAFDARIGREGLVEAAQATERLHARDVRVFGSERLPAGSFLALSNHPGVTDTLALFAALHRPELRAIALQRPFLESLAHLSDHLFYLPNEPNARVALVRQVAKHLRNGGAVLTFPAGRNEPDPDVYPGAAESLRSWIDSAAVFVRLAPATPVVPVCVRGVSWARTASHPLARLRRTQDDRQLLASAMQLMYQLLFQRPPVLVRVQIGQPVRIHERGMAEPGALHRAVLKEMRQLIQNPPQGEGESAL